MLSIVYFIASSLIFLSVDSHLISVKGHLKCAEYPASAVTVKLWKNSEKSVINDTHSDKQGYFELTANTIEQVYTPYIAVYHDCDDGVKPGQRKIKFEIPKYYVGSGLTFDLGSFNLETRVKHNEERQSHVDRRRRHQEELVERRTTQNVFRGRDAEPDERNDPW